MTIPYYHVDAFTNVPFAGNPAGVCILSAFPADGLMQRIAAENRHSQTAFVVRRPDGDFDLRWFTPAIEDDLCGHATLAAAYVLALARAHRPWPVRFHTRSGVLAVSRDGERFELDFPIWTPQPCAPAARPPGRARRGDRPGVQDARLPRGYRARGAGTRTRTGPRRVGARSTSGSAA